MGVDAKFCWVELKLRQVSSMLLVQEVCHEERFLPLFADEGGQGR